MNTLLLISFLSRLLTIIPDQHNDKLVWYGIDFSASKFVLVQENPQEIVSRYIPAINYVIITEATKYDIRKYFNANEVTYNIDPVTKVNSEINPSTLVSTKEQILDKEQLGKIISRYNTGNDNGTGLVFIAINLNKAAVLAEYYVCFFDISSKKLLDVKYMIAPPGGIGFRNYWVSTVYKVMNNWSGKYGPDPLYN